MLRTLRLKKQERQLLDSLRDDDFFNDTVVGGRSTINTSAEETIETIKSNQIWHQKFRTWIGSLFLILSLILLIIIQIPILVVGNIYKYIKCKKEELLFVAIGPFVGAPYLVDTVQKLRIVVFTNDHFPPHFHVITDRYNAKFTIDSCDFISSKGQIKDRHKKIIREWHVNNKNELMRVWLKTRAGDS